MRILSRLHSLIFGDVVLFDIETSGINPRVDRILSASFKRNGKIYSLRLGYSEACLAVDIRNELEKADLIVGWNSSRFDAPFLNARLLMHRDRPLMNVRHVDAMKLYKRKPRGLVDAANYFRVTDSEVHKTPIDWDIWRFAEMGNQDCMDYIVDHCEKDVELLDRVYSKLRRAK